MRSDLRFDSSGGAHNLKFSFLFGGEADNFLL
jgi:hypothetical protein